MPPLTARFRQGRSIRHAAGHAHGCGARDRPRAWMSNMALAFLWAKSGQHVNLSPGFSSAECPPEPGHETRP